MAIYVFLFLALCLQALAVDTLVDLEYTKYRGVTRNNVTQWLGMRYARSPSRLEGMRFAAPQDPLRNSTIQDANKFGPLCISTDFDLKAEIGDRLSEDCLFANVYAPATATTNSLLPVYIFIQGGGFNENGNADINGTDLIQAAQHQLVVVTFNYRVGPYGFLASKEVQANKTLSLNNGLKDQRQLMKWMNTHIKQFGGDPNHVVLGGASAGGASVVYHLTAYGGRDDHLFQAAAAESQAFPPLRDIKGNQYQYDALLKATGCRNLPCLQSMDAVNFQAAVRKLNTTFPGAKDPPIYFWGPVIDKDFIQDYTYDAINAGRFVKVPTIFGDATNEGITFTPKTITSQFASNQFIQDQFSSLSSSNLAKLEQAFPGPSNKYNDPTWRNRTAELYGLIRYICPGLNITNAYFTHNQTHTWNYRWNVGAATHISELESVWANGTSAAGVFVHNYFASFMRTYDPNAYKRDFHVEDEKAAKRAANIIAPPAWEQWGGRNGKRLVFDDGNMVKMEDVPQSQIDNCAVINSLGTDLNQLSSGGNPSLSPLSILFLSVQIFVSAALSL